MRSFSDYARTVAPAPAAGYECTVARSFTLAGFGLHTGRYVTVRVEPARPGHGIVFRRVLRNGRTTQVPALWTYRESQPLCTALRTPEGFLIRMIEHLMAALAALRIDNVLVELDAEELPAFDGSAVTWYDAIAAAGRSETARPRRAIRILRSVTINQGRRSLSIEPGAGLTISAGLELAHIGPQAWSGLITPTCFRSEIAPARSFGRYRRALLGRLYGFVARKPILQGCSPRSAALLIGNTIVGGSRFSDEPVRHRVLDVIGDLALVGHPIEGLVTAAHTGHQLNHALVARLMIGRDWELA